MLSSEILTRRLTRAFSREYIRLSNLIGDKLLYSGYRAVKGTQLTAVTTDELHRDFNVSVTYHPLSLAQLYSIGRRFSPRSRRYKRTYA
jgi:hypothetical protein